MYSFPPIYPVTGDNMNYVSVVYVVTFVIVGVWWLLGARKHFHPLMLRSEA